MLVNHTLRAWLRRAFQPSRKAAAKKRRSSYRLGLEELENRLVPSHTLTVTTTNDTHAVNPASGSGMDANGQVSLRAALETADIIGSSSSSPFTVNIPAGMYRLTMGFLQVGDATNTNVILNGMDLPTNVVVNQTDGLNNVFDLNPGLDPNVQISMANLEITGGNAQAFGGGGIVDGGTGNSLSLNNVLITGNSSHHAPGGGGIEFDGGNLTLTNCTISNNTAAGGTGGGLDFQPGSMAGSLTITSTTFTANTASNVGTAGGQGGAFYINGSAGNTYSISRCTISGNQATVDGGALANAHGAVLFNFNRVVGNSAPTGSGVFNASASDASIDATNNWWGNNQDPSIVSGLLAGSVTSQPWLLLGVTASPTALSPGTTATIAASFTHNSSGSVVSASNLTALVGLPVMFSATAGTIVPTAATIQSTGQATATYTAGAAPGPGTVSATVDAGSAATGLTINPAVSISTNSLSNWTAGFAGYNQTITATGGTGTLTFSATGPLPNGLTLTSTGVLSGTPTAIGGFTFTVTAADSVGSMASKSLSVVINPAELVTTATLPVWTAGLPGYNQTVTATGGTGQSTFAATGTLPPGLTLSSLGMLSGTPTTAGSFPFTITATDTIGASGTRNYTVTINPAVTITTSNLANWTAGLGSYAQTLHADGGTGLLTFSTLGSPPPGLTLSSGGVLAGTPISPGTYSFTVSATDSLSATGFQSYTVMIASPVTITTPTLANWTIGEAGYNQTIVASGGTGTLSISAAGPLPNGLTLTSAGVLSGTPTAAGSFTFTATATDTVNATGNKSFTVTINPPPAITTTALAVWTAGLGGYGQSILAGGGTGMLTFSATGSLPNGLTLSSSGLLSGTPAAAGAYLFSVTATDAVGASATQGYTLHINAPVSLATPSLTNWTAGLNGYSQPISVSGGTGNLTFSVTGALPTGLSLSSSGVLAGTPTVLGSFSFALTATDVLGANASRNYTIVINPPVSISTVSLPGWTAGYPGYSRSITTSGGTGNITISESGNFPDGLILGSSGLLLGTPAAAGNYSFTVIATDSVGALANQVLALVISPPVSVSTTTLTDWTSGLTGYNETISASGGTGPLNFTASGTLPTGLTLSTSGILSGAPNLAGNFLFTVTASDSVGANAFKAYTVNINPAVVILTTSLVPGTAGDENYSQSIAATGGTGLLTFGAIGSLPPGLSLSNTGFLSGTPTLAGNYSFSLTARDALGASGNQNETIVISPSISIMTPSLPNWTAGLTGYDQTIGASGGTGTLTFSSVSPLPTGLTLSNIGVLSGTPTASGSFNLTVSVSDTVGASTEKSYGLLINAPVSISNASLTNWTAGTTGYSQTIAGSGGTGLLTFSAVGIIPTGLTLSTAGLLAGTPTIPGSYTFAVMVSDSLGASATQNYSVAISPGIVVATPGLATGTVGEANYNQTISATGGTGSLTFSTTGTPPDGLTLNSAGALSGIPTKAGSYSFTIIATDVIGATGTHNYTVEINSAIAITTSTLADWTVGVGGYNQTIVATGGTGTITFGSTGSLPAGLTLATAGVLSGLPTAPGAYTFTVTTTDTVGASTSQGFTIHINPSISITTTSLTDWTSGLTGYNQTIAATGGTGTKSFAVLGSLPTGLTLSSTGALTGTPTTTGSFTFTVSAADTVGGTASKGFTVNVNPPVTITTSTLADWTAGFAGYSQTISGNGGTGSLSFSLTGAAPPGLTLSSSGVLSGTPSGPGSYSFIVAATESVGASASSNFTVVINPPVMLTTASLANWTAGQAGYNQTITATGGTGSLIFAATGSLPAGLTFSNAGVLSGTPTTAGSYTIGVTAFDSLGAAANHGYALVVNQPVGITTASLANWTAGLAGYNQTIATSGGTGSKTFAVVGSLPAGLTLSSTGVVSGTPTTTGSYTFTITVTDAVGASGGQSFTVAINPAIAVTTTTLANWTTGFTGYNQTITANGGTGGITFSTSGSTPPGLTLSSTGILSGTPTTAGSYGFLITAIDAVGANVSESYTVVINLPVTFTTASLSNWTAGLAGYNQTIQTSGGTGSVLLAATGSLPAGLTLSSTGVLSGTPSTAGSFTVGVTAFDSLGAAASHNFTLVINAPVAITTATLANWTSGLTGYNQTVAASEGTGTLTFSAGAGLPAGLTLNPAGVLSGTPATVGSYNFTVTVTDSVGATANRSYTVVIAPAVAITTSSVATWTANLGGYNQTIGASGGTGPLVFVATSTLPSGLTLSSSGVLSGTPTTAGSYSVSVTAFDTVGAAGSHTFTVVISPAPTITTPSLATWTADLSGYSQTVNATGGSDTLTLHQTGSLPAGLTFSSTGVLSGTPTTSGTFNLMIAATDGLGATTSRSYTLTISPAIVITTASLPNWTTAHAGYLQTILASGGTGTLTFSETGTLPAGLTLGSSGVLSGTPAGTGTYAFTVVATDSLGAKGSKGYSVSINPALAISPTSLPAAMVGNAYMQSITATGGTLPYSILTVTGFSAGGTGLAASAISANPATGVVTINGTPTGVGTVMFTVNATDAVGATLSQTYSLTVQTVPMAGFVISVPAVAAANGFFNFTVTAVNSSNQPITGYNGTVHFTSSDGAAILPTNTMLTGGTGTFTATLVTPGSQTIKVADLANPALNTTSTAIQVTSPTAVVVSPSFSGAPGSMTGDGHTIGFDAFATIQQALNVVAAGGSVFVGAASYHESLTVSKSVTLAATGSTSAMLIGPGSGTGLTITGPHVNVSGLTVENFGTGLSAANPTTSLVMSDLSLQNNTAGGSITNVNSVAFIGTGGDETLLASATHFGRSGDNLLTFSDVGSLALDGNGGNNTLDLSTASGPVGVALFGTGSLEGFAGTVSIPGVIFTNVTRLVGNSTAGSSLSGLNAPATWSVNGASMSQYGSGGQTLSFTSFPVLNGGTGSDTFMVNGSPASGLTINGQGGGDSFQVPLAGLAGPVALNESGSGVNAATLTGAGGNSSLTVTANSVTLTGGGTVTYAGLTKLALNAGAGADTIAVQGTAAGTTTTISGTGTDTFVVTSPSGLLNTIAGPLSLNGGTGKNYLYLSEANRTTPDTVYVTDTAIISGTGTFAPISYAATGGNFGSGVILIMGNADNTLRVFSTAAGDAYGLYTGNGNSSIVISSATQTLSTMAGSIAVVAGSGSNMLYVSEAGSSTPDSLSLSATGIQSTAANFAVSYVAPGGTFGHGVYLVTGNGNNNVRIYSTAAGSTNGIELGNGNNNVVVSSPTQTLSTMAGPIGVQGGTGVNQLYVSEAGSTVPDSIFVSGVSVQSPTLGYFISYTAAPGGSFGRGVDVVGGSGGSHVYVVGQLAGSPIGIYSGSGNDVIEAFVSAMSFYNLWLNGQGGTNHLYVHDLAGSAMISAVAGVIQLNYPGGLPSTIRYSNLLF